MDVKYGQIDERRRLETEECRELNVLMKLEVSSQKMWKNAVKKVHWRWRQRLLIKDGPRKSIKSVY